MKCAGRVLIIDYGLGNIQSICNAVRAVGWEPQVSGNPKDIPFAQGFILPGVGTFGAGIQNLESKGLINPLAIEVLEKKKPVLGICLGMQLLANESEEGPQYKGLGWLPASVSQLRGTTELRIPHVGWSPVSVYQFDPLFNGLKDRESFYFVNSYVFSCDSQYVVARFSYGIDYVAAVQSGNILGTQFHPEKSSRNGMVVLRNFLNLIQNSKE